MVRVRIDALLAICVLEAGVALPVARVRERVGLVARVLARFMELVLVPPVSAFRFGESVDLGGGEARKKLLDCVD